MTTIFLTAKNMFSAYLNQDFELLFGTVDDALRAFVERSARDEVRRVIDELRELLAMKLPEGDLQRIIYDELGACYYYPNEWPSAELWLRHVLALLDA